MKNKLFSGVFLSLFFVLSFLVSYAPAAQDSTDNKAADSEVTVYLKSGEVIKGSVESKTDKEIVLKKYGASLPINLSEVLRMEEVATGKGLSAANKLPFSTAIITYDLKGGTTGKEVVYHCCPN